MSSPGAHTPPRPLAGQGQRGSYVGSPAAASPLSPVSPSSVTSPAAAAAPTRVCLAIQQPVSWVAAWVLTRLQSHGATTDDAPAPRSSGADSDADLTAVLESFTAGADTEPTDGGDGAEVAISGLALAPVPRSRAVGVLTNTLHMLVQRLTNLARDTTTTQHGLTELVAIGGASRVWLCELREHLWLMLTTSLPPVLRRYSGAVHALQLARRRSEYVCCLSQYVPDFAAGSRLPRCLTHSDLRCTTAVPAVAVAAAAVLCSRQRRYHAIAGVLGRELVSGPVLKTHPVEAAAYFARSNAPLSVALAWLAQPASAAPATDEVCAGVRLHVPQFGRIDPPPPNCRRH